MADGSRGLPWGGDMQERALAMLTAGASTWAVERELGVPHTTVWRWMRDRPEVIKTVREQARQRHAVDMSRIVDMAAEILSERLADREAMSAEKTKDLAVILGVAADKLRDIHGADQEAVAPPDDPAELLADRSRLEARIAELIERRKLVATATVEPPTEGSE